MKKEFSKSWISSKQKRKQRKYRFNAPLHLRHKMLSSNLSKELRKKYGIRSMELRKDDKIKIMRGEFRGKEGKIIKVNMQKLKVYIEGIQRTKKDGSKVNVPLDPSNLQINEMVIDRMRIKSSPEKTEEKEKK